MRLSENDVYNMNQTLNKSGYGFIKKREKLKLVVFKIKKNTTILLNKCLIDITIFYLIFN